MNLKQFIINRIAGYNVEEKLSQLRHNVTEEQNKSASLRSNISSYRETIAGLNRQAAKFMSDLGDVRKELEDYQKECEKLGRLPHQLRIPAEGRSPIPVISVHSIGTTLGFHVV